MPADAKAKENPFDRFTVDELFAEGIRQFNAEEFYECHEALEALWNRQSEPEKQFTQGIIQIAVGLYHARRDNLVGANKLLPRGLARIRPFAPEHLGLEITEFIISVEQIFSLTSTSESNSTTFAAPKLQTTTV